MIFSYNKMAWEKTNIYSVTGKWKDFFVDDLMTGLSY